jgi:hypothetical protein
MLPLYTSHLYSSFDFSRWCGVFFTHSIQFEFSAAKKVFNC